MLTLLTQFLYGPLFQKLCISLILLVVGILAIRIIGKILRKALEKSKLEKAAHSLIPAIAIFKPNWSSTTRRTTSI